MRESEQPTEHVRARSPSLGALSASPEQSITVDVWAVSDGHQAEFVDALVGLFEHLRALDGFIDGQILKGVDPTVFVS